MARSRKAVTPEGEDEPVDPILRAKYLDYCSARVADLLLQLTADEMYVLSQDAARELGAEEERSLSYNEIVRLATDRIFRKLSLPDYPTWVAQYRADPDTLERELLGLWEAELRT